MKHIKFSQIRNVLIVVVIGFSLLYVFAINSEPYLAAKIYIEQTESSNLIAKEIGILKSVSLPFFGPYSFRTYKKGISYFELNVVGENKNGKVFIRLQKNTGEYIVLSAFLVTQENILLVIK